MDTHADIVNWAKKMGYAGKIPDNFKVVCNASTTALWSQVVNKVRPRETVQHSRRNLIVRQLAATLGGNKPLKYTLNLLPHNLEEVRLAGEKQRLSKDVENMRAISEKRERELDNISRQNRALYIRIESIEKNTLEYESKTYLYEKKSVDINKEITSAEERLALCRNLTPVEGCEEQHRNVLEDLNNCVTKLKTFLKSRQQDENDSSIYQNTSVVSTKCTPRMGNKFGNYFTESSTKLYGNDSVSESQLRDMDAMRLHKVYQDVGTMLQTQNRGEIWNALCRVEEEMRINLKKFIIQNVDGKRDICNTKADHLSKLYSIHIEKELEAMRCNLLLKHLEKQIECRLIGIRGILQADGYSSGVIEETNTILACKKDNITSSTAGGVLLKSLDDLKLVAGNGNELQQLQAKALGVQYEIVSTVRNLLGKLNFFEHTQKTLHATRDETFFLIRKLEQFTGNFSWVSPLQDNLITHEVHLFKNFCVDYNRKFTFTKRKEDYNLPLPSGESVDSVVDQLSLLLDKPNCFPEIMLVDVLQSKIQVRHLESLNAIPLVPSGQKFSIEALQERESYIDTVLGKLSQVVLSENPCKKSMSSSKMQEIMKIWYEMPFKELVSVNRVFEGNNYKYYEQFYDSIYSKA